MKSAAKEYGKCVISNWGLLSEATDGENTYKIEKDLEPL